MKIIDATPPADYPRQIIICDAEFAKRYQDKFCYLRVANEDDSGVKVVDLDGAVTPQEARNMAVAMGFDPTHWHDVALVTPIRF